ncbi:MAG TPA: hypothetical protein VJT72_10855 [Pseudonocardiaceae bacterium]|nr:hypothetical protein [Pseudonocardiaceae bacterium]
MELFAGIRRILANPQRQRLDEQLGMLTADGRPDNSEVNRYLGIARGWQAAGKIDAGWAALHRACEAEIDLMTVDQAQGRAQELAEELRSGKIPDWRSTAALEQVTIALSLLAPDAAPEQADTARVWLRSALRIRNEHFDNVYRNLAISRRYRNSLILLAVLMLITAVVLMSVIGAANLDPDLTSGDPFSGNWLLALAIIFGTLGALSSALQRRTRDPFVGRIPEHLGVLSIFSTRPLIGAIAGLTAYISVRAGITVLQDHPVPGMLAAAFVAGFTERLVVLKTGESDPNSLPQVDGGLADRAPTTIQRS